MVLLGLQFRMVDSYVLTPEFTKLLAKQAGNPMAAATDSAETLLGAKTSFPSKTVRLPEWIGWAFLSMGAVFILHSMAMPRPS